MIILFNQATDRSKATSYCMCKLGGPRIASAPKDAGKHKPIDLKTTKTVIQ